MEPLVLLGRPSVLGPQRLHAHPVPDCYRTVHQEPSRHRLFAPTPPPPEDDYLERREMLRLERLRYPPRPPAPPLPSHVALARHSAAQPMTTDSHLPEPGAQHPPMPPVPNDFHVRAGPPVRPLPDNASQSGKATKKLRNRRLERREDAQYERGPF